MARHITRCFINWPSDLTTAQNSRSVSRFVQWVRRRFGEVPIAIVFSVDARFDRWMCDRYRTTLQQVDPVGYPPTDHLYVNLDDVLARSVSAASALDTFPSHSYVNWTEAALKQSEDALLLSVSKHIEFLVETIRPQSQLFIAVSGMSINGTDCPITARSCAM